MSVCTAWNDTAGESDITIPSPERIHELTAAIRKRWSRAELRRRTTILPLFELLLIPVESRRTGY